MVSLLSFYFTIQLYVSTFLEWFYFDYNINNNPMTMTTRKHSQQSWSNINKCSSIISTQFDKELITRGKDKWFSWVILNNGCRTAIPLLTTVKLISQCACHSSYYTIPCHRRIKSPFGASYCIWVKNLWKLSGLPCILSWELLVFDYFISIGSIFFNYC